MKRHLSMRNCAFLYTSSNSKENNASHLCQILLQCHLFFSLWMHWPSLHFHSTSSLWYQRHQCSWRLFTSNFAPWHLISNEEGSMWWCHRNATVWCQELRVSRMQVFMQWCTVLQKSQAQALSWCITIGNFWCGCGWMVNTTYEKRGFFQFIFPVSHLENPVKTWNTSINSHLRKFMPPHNRPRKFIACSEKRSWK